MALDLFANYERTQHSSVFYRLTASSPYTITIRLSDLFASDPDYTIYEASSSINGESFEQFSRNNQDNFITSVNWNVTTPCVCSITVSVSTEGTLSDTFSISGVFVNSLPVADFVAYPTYVVFRDVNNAVKVKTLNASNYSQSEGVFFYGEGHTEIINLSSSAKPTEQTVWYVGNELNNVGQFDSVWPLSAIDNNESKVEIPSSPGQQSEIPISVLLTDGTILSSAPIIRYNDATGQREFYSYFTSSLNITGGPNSNNTKFKDSIEIRPYPTFTFSAFQSPFSAETFLPFDYSDVAFRSTIQTLSGSSVLTESFVGSKWILSAAAGFAEWSVDTGILPGICGYQFQLGYYTNEIENFLPLFKASSTFSTTVTLNVSAQKIIQIDPDNGPSDWLPVTINELRSFSTIVKPIPAAKIYFPNYFVEKNTAATLFAIPTVEEPYELETITIQSPYSPNTVVLTPNNLSASMVFDELGMADLSATFVIKNNSIVCDTTPYTVTLTGSSCFQKHCRNWNWGSLQCGVSAVDITWKKTKCSEEFAKKWKFEFCETTITPPLTCPETTTRVGTVLQNIVEVVEKFDDVDEEFYQTSVTPLELTYTEQPKIVPNEWAIADNVNSVIRKFYQTLEELDRYTKLYEQKSRFYGWIGPRTNNALTIESSAPQYVWQDLECPSSIIPEEGSWAAFECVEGNEIPESTWEYHECTGGGSQQDSNCLQKYCIEWKWKSRKCAVSEIDVSWKEAKCDGSFAKKWKYEECELSAPDLNCDRDSWKISTLDSQFFPIPSCSSKQRCKIVDIEHLETSGHLVVAYPTELNVVENDYFTTRRSRQTAIDRLFLFQNIVGLTTNSEGKIIVLDSILSRVSVFRFIDDKLKLFNTWGTFGLQSSPQGFNQPSDIHIDQQNSLWITDTGNKCIKKLTINGKHLMTITNEQFETNPPKSCCVDSQLNCHVLTEGKVLVFDPEGQYSFEYILPEIVVNTAKINTSYNRETIYITYEFGVVKFFRTGTIYGYLFHEYECKSGDFFIGYNSITQDKFRNVYITIGDKFLKVPDLMKIAESKAPLNPNLYWKLNDLLIHKEEYIQPWVYLKSFHRLWDNIELLRNALFYDVEGCKSFKAPIYSKEDLVIGQNELVMNTVINRLSFQLWTNLQKLIEYFDPNCKGLTIADEVLKPAAATSTLITFPEPPRPPLPPPVEKGIVTLVNNTQMVTFGNNTPMFPFQNLPPGMVTFVDSNPIVTFIENQPVIQFE